MIKLLLVFAIGLVIGSASMQHYDNKLMRAYQIRIEDSALYLYDRNRLVGYGPYTQNWLDTAIIKDNE